MSRQSSLRRKADSYMAYFKYRIRVPRKVSIQPSRPKPASSLPSAHLLMLALSEDVDNEDSIEERGCAVRAD